MKIEDILTLMEKLDASSLTRMVLKEGETELELSKDATLIQAPAALQPVMAAAPAQAPAPAVQSAAPMGDHVVAEESNIAYITSPIVGTFYEAASPATPAFVKPGDKVAPGQVVCILEAMKLMNEIESEISGEILEVLVKNEDMVEFGQKLFKVRLG